MAKMIDFIEENYNIIQTLFSYGKVSQTLINEYHIYKEYQKLKDVDSKMLRYSIVSDLLRISEKSVTRAVSNMEKEVN